MESAETELQLALARFQKDPADTNLLISLAYNRTTPESVLERMVGIHPELDRMIFWTHKKSARLIDKLVRSTFPGTRRTLIEAHVLPMAVVEKMALKEIEPDIWEAATKELREMVSRLPAAAEMAK